MIRARFLLTFLVVALSFGSALPAFAQEPAGQRLSTDGLTATDGTRTLSVTKARGLNPAGESITITGNGYDTEKGIYVAFCLIPPPNQVPTPCGGGMDTSGSGTAAWISSNAPTYGSGLSNAYKPGGGFSFSLTVSPVINDATDCRVVRCALVSRNDHTRTTDRSQDVMVPLTFAGSPVEAAVPAPAPVVPTAAPATGAAAAAPTAVASGAAPAPAAPRPAPAAVISTDGKTATAGTRTLAVSKVASLDPNGESVQVSGRGYGETRGVYVALCAVAADGALGPCSSGAVDASVWVSSNPPDYGKTIATPYKQGGFDLPLTVKPVIDAKTNCRVVACAISTRADDTGVKERAFDQAVPIKFATAPVAAIDTSTGGGGTPWLFIAIGAGLIALVGGFFLLRRPRGSNGIFNVVASTGLISLLITTACGHDGLGGGDPSNHNQPVVVVDSPGSPKLPATAHSSDGREVVVTDISRIVPLSGNVTEIVWGLGLGDKIVGRDITATFPEAAHLPLVTRAHDVSAEAVLSLKPTLVLASENTGPSVALEQIRNVGIPVIRFAEPDSLEDILPRIRDIAASLGVPSAGEKLVEKTQGELAKVQAGIPRNGQPPRVAFLYMRGQAGVYLISGPNSGADSMIKAAGGIDAGTAMGLTQEFTPITSEALVKAAPDAILMTTTGLASVGGIDGLVKIPGIAQTPAGRQRRVVTIEDGLLFGFGPRTPIALGELIAGLYPPQ